MAKRREIRNSTAEFLIFQIEGKNQGVEVFYKDKTVWCTQKAMGILFDCTSDNVSVHLKNIYDTNELKRRATAEKFSVVRREGNRDVNRTLQFYNLDAIISVGCRDDSQHFYFPQTEAVLGVPPCHRVCVSFVFLNSILYTFPLQQIACRGRFFALFFWSFKINS